MAAPETGPSQTVGEDKPDRLEKRKPKKRYDDTKGDTIFLRNVSRYDTDEESLKALMEENFGETVYCLICKDKETGESRGTAFVKFKEPATAQKCLEEFKDRELQYKFHLDGRNLFVLSAMSRDEAQEVRDCNAKRLKLDAEAKKKGMRAKKKEKREKRKKKKRLRNL